MTTHTARPMGRRALLGAMAGGALALVAGAAGQRALAQDAGSAMVTTVAVNFRNGPGTTFGVIRVLPAGTTVRVTGVAESGFRLVLSAGTTGWVAADFLAQATGTPAPATGRPPSSTAFTGTMKVLEPVNFRSGPATTSSIDLTLAAQQVVEVSDLYQNGFRACRLNGLLGWLIAGALVPFGTGQPSTPPTTGTAGYINTAAAFRSSAAYGENVIATLAVGTVVTITGEASGDFRPVTVNGTAGWVFRDYVTAGTPSEVPTAPAYVTVDVNLRSSPDYGNNVITVLTALTRVGTDRRVSGDFTEVYTADQRRGWVFTAYLALGEPPLVEPGTPGSNQVTTAAANLRASASTSSAVLLVIPAGASVAVTGANSNGFLPVTYNGTSGWVFGVLLTSGGGGTPGADRIFYTTAAVNLREQPSLSGRVLTVVPAGTAVRGTGVEPVPGWSGPYGYGGVTGYISSQYLRV